MRFLLPRALAAPAFIAFACAAATTPAKRPAKVPAPPPIKASLTVRRWMRTMTLRDEVAQTVAAPEEIDGEIRDLFAAFQSG